MRKLVSIIGLWLMSMGAAHAVLEIQITGGVKGGVPIAIVPFQWAGPGPAPDQDVAAIVAADLGRTGRFKIIPKKDFLERPHQGSEINFDNWRALGVEDLVVGRVLPTANGNYKVQFQLFDIYKKSDDPSVPQPDYKVKQLTGYNIPTPHSALRATAHYISDIIYEKLTGQRGAFSTRIAYVTATGSAKDRSYSLQVADADGHNPHEILQSSQPIMSPAWSPDGGRLAYVSFEGGHASIYIQDLATGRRQLVSSKPGINGAPAWSPDGKSLAMTLSFQDDGNPEVYIMNLATRKLRRLTYNSAIDTGAVWAPDGKSLVFTSDRSGGPQLYRIPAEGGRAQRLTFEGSYNASAAFSPDGNMLAMVHQDGGKFRIAVQDLKTGLFRVLTDGSNDESPTFAPNGSMILYATDSGRQGVLAAVSVDGRVPPQKLVFQQGDVREPAWGPFSEQ